MNRFIAIPVTQGDAFFLDRGGCTVLIDGGGNRSSFSTLFHRSTGRLGASIVACTHNDLDHANGIRGFLESGLKCDEIWLPGRWLGLLSEVLKPLEDVTHRLVGETTEVQLSEGDAGSDDPLELLTRRMAERECDTTATHDDEREGSEHSPELTIAGLETAQQWDASLWPLYGHYFDLATCLRTFHWPPGSLRHQLLVSAIDAADRIRSIAFEACHRGIPIRWFEYEPANPSGGNSLLVPLNGREIRRVPPVPKNLLTALALSTSNKESLVFWSPAQSQGPGVLFSADSDFAGVCLNRLTSNALVTAPHHGSDSNAVAYITISSALGPHANTLTWVRSDRGCNSRPGKSFLSLGPSRFCTICRTGVGTYTAKQQVRLSAKGGRWVPGKTTRQCCCR